MSEENIKIVLDCPLCDQKELQVIEQQNTKSMQCIGCGYSSTEKYNYSDDEDPKDNIHYKSLGESMQKWAKFKENQIWIPSIVTIPHGMLYPIDVDKKMTWAFIPAVKIQEEEKEKYKKEDGTYYEARYDSDKQITFESFKKAIFELNTIISALEAKIKEKNGKSKRN